jgi:anti-anti-sigma factor
MKRHQLAPVTSLSTTKVGGALAGVAAPTLTVYDNNPRKKPASSRASLALASVRTWTHTLVLTGGLDRASANALEAEIERLCDEGVTGITLDLRELTYIDSIGVAVIAFRCDLCKRRGFDFALIPGAPSIQRAFEQAGVSELLPFQEGEVADPQRTALALSNSARRGGDERRA